MKATARVSPQLLALLLVLPLAACSGDDEETLTVLAAASLTDTFTELAATFEEQHPGVQVELSFGSSTTLAQQLVDGAPGDVLATADPAAMDLAAVAIDPDAEVRGFVANQITLVTPSPEPVLVSSPAGLDDPGIDYVVCVETAPCGKVAAAVLDDEGVTADPASEEVDVRAVLARVVEGEADAGLVYASDAVAAGPAVTTIALPSAADHATDYAIAPAADTDQAELAGEWIDLVTGPEGQDVLDRAGFTVSGP